MVGPVVAGGGTPLFDRGPALAPAQQPGDPPLEARCLIRQVDAGTWDDSGNLLLRTKYARGRPEGRRTVMGEVIVSEFMTLDGVVQAPVYPDEDETGGFAHGGWHTAYMDDAVMKWTLENVAAAGGFLLGRRTYETFAAHWPKAGEEEQPLAEPLNTKPKYVASSTLQEPLEWENSSLLSGDAVEATRALKEQDGADLLLLGSTSLAQALMQAGLVDQIRLTIDPVLAGSGKRIFTEDGVLRPLRLVDSQISSTGAVLATYIAASGES